MSDAGPTPRRIQLIAISLAVAALVTALVAVVVVLNRSAGGEHASSAAIEDRRVSATDVVKLGPSTAEIVIERGVTRGARVKDQELARALFVGPTDVITTISGRAIHLDSDFHDVMFNTSLMHATTLYVELERDHQPVLVRWMIDGDLRRARLAGGVSALSSFPSYPSPPPPAPDPLSSLTPFRDPVPDLDPLLDTIKQIDDTHYEIPRATIDAVLANPMAVAKGARVVPAVQNGVASGFKLYAIRPSSAYAKIGLQNGDTVRAVNNYEMTAPDKALDAYAAIKSAKQITIELVRRGRPVILEITVTK